MTANFILNDDHLTILRNKAKLNSFFNNTLTKTFFKVSKNEFILFQRGVTGAFSTRLEIKSNINTPIYYSVDYSKWSNALAKFSNLSEIAISVKKNMMTFSTSTSNDTINLGIISYDSDSSEAILIDNFIKEKYNEIINPDFNLDLTEELIEDFQLADSLFSSAGKNNAIGLSKNEVIYSDRSVVLKIKLSEILDDKLFKNLGEENYIFIHSFFLKMFTLLSKTNTEVYFSNDYGSIYWEDEYSSLLINSENREVALPTEEQWNMIKPEDEDCLFNIELGEIISGLNFFTGFYEESAWKPVTFEINNNSVVLYYRHPTTEISKCIVEDTSGLPVGNFMISSEIMSKILSKISNRFTLEENVTINYDDEAPGIYCKVNDVYEFILSKVIDSMQE